MDHNAYRQIRQCGENGPDVEVAPGHLLTDLIYAVPQAVAAVMMTREADGGPAGSHAAETKSD